MSVRITRKSAAQWTVLRVDGHLTADDVDELARESRSVEGALALDLVDLRSADSAGVSLLQELLARGAELRGASPYIELLLQRQAEQHP
jgi:ABC-type transporter Mla MlaB component